MRMIIAAALVASVATIAIAQQPPMAVPGAPDVKRVVAGSYKIEPSHAQVLFTVNHLGFTQYTGQFTNPTGTLVLDLKNLGAAKVDVTFPIKNVSTTVKALDDHLMKPEFFDADKFPEGHFVSTKVVAKGLTAVITGNLTLKGVTKPVVLNARFVGAGFAPFGPKKTNIGFSATTSIKRSDFGISYGVPVVSDKVDLVINAGFVAE